MILILTRSMLISNNVNNDCLTLCKTLHQIQLRLFSIVARNLIKQSKYELCEDNESKRDNALEKHANIAFKK